MGCDRRVQQSRNNNINSKSKIMKKVTVLAHFQSTKNKSWYLKVATGFHTVGSVRIPTTALVELSDDPTKEKLLAVGKTVELPEELF